MSSSRAMGSDTFSKLSTPINERKTNFKMGKIRLDLSLILPKKRSRSHRYTLKYFFRKETPKEFPKKTNLHCHASGIKSEEVKLSFPRRVSFGAGMATCIESLTGAARIAARLYVQDVCREFTRPIEVIYPELGDEYRATVAHPTDLGSILLKCLQEEEMDLEELRAELMTMLSNAMEFNQGEVLIENTALHIRCFAAGLFEEISGQTWDGSEDSGILRRRQNRFVVLEREFLHQSEVKEIKRVLDVCVKKLKGQSTALHAAVTECQSVCDATLLSASRAVQLCTIFEPLVDIAISDQASSTSSDGDSVPGLTCLLLLQRLDTMNGEDKTKSYASCIALHRKSLTLGSEVPSAGMTPLSVIAENASVYSSKDTTTKQFLQDLDDAVGEVLVIIEERLTRGSAQSSYWAKPLEAVWAQPDTKETSLSKIPWWPCIVLGGGSDTCVSKSLTQANINRLPAEVVKQLKQRCRSFAKGMGTQEEKAVKNRNFTATPEEESGKCMNGLETLETVGEPKGGIVLASEKRGGAGPRDTLQVPSTARVASDPRIRPGTHSELGIGSAAGTTPFVIPPKCLLVEYFDVHDVGLVYAEYVMPLTSPVQFPIKALLASKKAGAGEQANNRVFETFQTSVRSLTSPEGGPVGNDAAVLPSVDQLRHSVAVLAESSQVVFEEKKEDPAVQMGEAPKKWRDIVSAAIATVDGVETDALGAYSSGSSSPVLSPRSGGVSPPAASAPQTDNTLPLPSPPQLSKRSRAEGDEAASFPPHAKAFKNCHFLPDFAPIKPMTVTDIPTVLASGRTRGGQANQSASHKKHRALVRTRMVVEWLEATNPLESLASSAAYLDSEKEAPCETPLSLQMRALRAAAGITELPEPKNLIPTTTSIKAKEGAATGPSSSSEGKGLWMSSSSKKTQFRSADHITKDFSRVTPSSHPSFHAAQFMFGEGIVHTRSAVPGAPLFHQESSVLDERIAVLKGQIQEFESKLRSST